MFENPGDFHLFPRNCCLVVKEKDQGKVGLEGEGGLGLHGGGIMMEDGRVTSTLFKEDQSKGGGLVGEH